MATKRAGDRRPLAVVTGGGGGIGAAIAEELGRRGTFVVTVDPLVSLDGTEQLADPQETTAGRIVAAGGAARASSASVTDRSALEDLFGGLADEFGGLDAVVNVAGITRPTSFTRGTEQDWRAVLSVHLDGYLNVLGAALPIMAVAGHGHILGVTSGSGWRPADAGAYGCAKRAVASLTWQLGRHAPPGVVINAISPIAMTRMVAAAMKRRQPDKAPSSDAAASPASATGGLSLGAMPGPEQLGPLAAHLVSDGFAACCGRVLFTAGSEIAVIDEPRLLEVLPSRGAAPLADVLEAVTSAALVPAELHQQSSGGSNPRPGSTFDQLDADALPPPVIRSCAVLADRPDLAEALAASLESRGVLCHRVSAGGTALDFEAALEALGSATGDDGTVDAVVLAPASMSGAGAPNGSEAGDWGRVLAEHSGIVEQIQSDATWARAVADVAERSQKSIRLVTLTDATTAGGRSRAQASAQLARASRVCDR